MIKKKLSTPFAVEKREDTLVFEYHLASCYEYKQDNMIDFGVKSTF